MTRSIIDDGFDPPEELAVGHAEVGLPDSSTSFDGVKGVLWIPDPEARHFWRELYVREAPKPKPGGRVGF